MTKNLYRWAAGAIGAAATLMVSSCAYDPSYSSGGSYAYESYGEGYGYGNSSFSTSIFVGTGDPRWGYDPYTYSYYDYNRRAYYDPYLYGYYPVGYRPRPVYGVPHPGGWRPGRGYCPPPSRVRSYNLSNYRNRETAYRGTNYSWANQVRARDAGSPVRGGSSGAPDRGRGNDSGRPQWNNGGSNNNSQRDGGVRYGSDRSNVTRPSFGGVQSPARTAREDYNRGGSQSQNRPQQFDRSARPQQGGFQPGQQQQSGRRPSSPSGFNSPVGITPDRSPAPQQRFVPQQRVAPQPQQGGGQFQPQRQAPQAPQSRQFQGGGNGGGGAPSGGGGGGRRSAPPSQSGDGGGGDGRRSMR